MAHVEARTTARGDGSATAGAPIEPAADAPAKRAHAPQDLIWPEFRTRLASNLPILIPLAAVERTGAICAPVLPFGNADFFRRAARGVQLRAAITDFVASFRICNPARPHLGPQRS